MALAVAPFQLLLFPGSLPHNWHPSPLGRAVRDKRTGLQWVKSVIAYCEWRAGDSWRNLSYADQRSDPERWTYLDAARAVHSAFYRDEPTGKLHFALPVLNAEPPPLPGELDLAELPRKVLVSALLRENPSLTNSKLLGAFKRRKLAHMLASLRLSASEARPEKRRA